MLFSLLLCVAVGVPIFAVSQAQGDGESASVAEVPAPSAGELAEAEREEREHAEWLMSPEAQKQREASSNAYANLTAGEAQNLLVEAFPQQLKALNADPARVLSTLEVERPLGTYGALVSDEEGERAILNSSVPVQSDLGGEDKEPVDLTLKQSGSSFVPQNPITEVELPGSAEEPVQLESGVEVKLPASDDHDAVPLGAMNLFYPETETATDTLVAPKAGGVEVFEQLRSPESPERFSFALQLPHEATLRRSESGGAEIVNSSGRTIGEIPPPSATDAQGATVPVTTSIEGDSLVLEVSHRASEVAYPVLLDPEYVNDTTSFGEWSPSLNSGYEYYLNNNWSSLDAISRGNYFYAANTHGQWAYGAYGQTGYIAAATFSPVYFIVHTCQTYDPHGYIGLYNPGSGKYDALGLYATWYSEGTYQTGWNGGTGTRDAIIGIGTGGTGVKIGCAHELYVGGYSIQEKDPEAPTVNSVGGTSANWVKEVTVTPHVSDPGLGVKAITLSPEGASPHTNSQGCAGANGSRCPGSWETSFGVSYFFDGERSASVTAYDPLGPDVSSHVSSSYPFTTRLDRQNPEVELEGEFTEALEEAKKEGEGNEAPALHLPVYNLRIDATDKANEGNPKTEPKARRSGVKNLAVFLDGKELKVPWSAQACSGPEYSCPMEETYPVPMDEVQGGGVHEIEVIAEDQVGNKRKVIKEFEYFPATGMKDEYVMQHFPLPDGEGDESEEEHPVRPELAVNVTNGNLVYRQKDVEVSGPNVDLEVERFYNSQLPEEDNTEWGDGWTLAQTPKLEPEETKEGSPARASMVRTSGALESTVGLPTESGGTQFDKKLQALVTKEAGGGYEVADETGETNGALAFDSTGKVTELRTPGYAKVNYSYEGGDLAEIAVDDPSSTNAPPPDAQASSLAPPVYGFAFGAYGTGNGQFSSFGGIATAPAGYVYVADSGNHRVEKFDPNGAYVSQFGKAGAGEGQFGTIAGIAVAPDGSIYVADSSGKRVEKFDSNGTYVSQFGKEGTGEGQFGKGIGGLAVDGAGNVYASDYAGKRILKFSSSGAYVSQIADSQLTSPHAIAVNAAGELWAVDWGDERIEKFNAAGAHIAQFSTAGQAALSWPQGIAVDEGSGDVWVTDSEAGRVVGFSPSGAYLGQFGTEGLGEGQLAEPNWLAIDAKGGFYVSNPITRQVQKWVTKAAPSAKTETAGSVVETSATLHATVNPTTLDTHYSFEWGPTSAYGHSIPVSAKDIGAGAKDVKVAEKIEGLKPWVLYHFRVAATNADGTAYGADQQLTTWGEWSLESPPLPKASTSSSLADVSCTSAVNCVAVGYDSYTGRMLGETWNGTKWTLTNGTADQNPTSVSCGSGVSCWGVGTKVTGTTTEVLLERWESEEGEWWRSASGIKPVVPEGATNLRLSGIACTTATECTAVGYYTKEGQTQPLAERLAANKWIVQTMPSLPGTTLTDLACSSAGSCVAVGYKSVKGVGLQGVSVRWNGTEWSTLTTPGPKVEGWAEQRLTSVSCGASTSCKASGNSVNEEGEVSPYVLSYNGSEFSLATLPTLKVGSSLASMSCTSASACLAVGHAAEGGTLAVGWDGSKWTTRSSLTPKEKTAWLIGVSCVGSLSCTTVGKQVGGGETTPLAERVGEIWTLESPPLPKASNSSGLGDVSCTSALSCVAIGSDGYATRGLGEVWNGEKWTLLNGTDNTIPTSVSCGSATSCWAVGTKGTSTAPEVLLEHWESEEGEWWRSVLGIQPVAPGGATNLRLNGIACTSATECTAVGTYTKESQTRALAERLVANKWTLQTTPEIAGANLSDISCASATSCLAVGYKTTKGIAPESFSERWNGSEWSTLTVPAPKTEGWVERRLTSISCASAASCVAVGYSMNEEAERLPLAVTYDGNAWSLTTLPTLKVGSSLASVSCAAPGNCLAVGHAAEGGTLALGWSGGEWTLRSSPTPKGKTAWLNGVSCLAPLTCTSVGQSTGGGETAPMADRVELRNQAATTGAATSVTPAAATLNATVNPHGLSTKYSFEYGPTKAYGSMIPAPSKEAGSGIKDIAVSNAISGLEAGRLYHYRLVATSEVGTTYGQDKTFTTPPPSFAFDFGAQGSGEGQFTNPAGVASDTEGNVYVADAGNHRVVKFNSRGGFVSAFGKEGTGEAQFTTISAITVGPEGYVYVVDSGQRKVKRFKAGGEFVSQFGAEGTGNGQFGSLIGGVAVDKGGVVWASDSTNHRVERFDATGKYLSKLGTEGSGNGQFGQPRAIAIDGGGNAWVVDLGHERVEQFNSTGGYQRQFGKLGKGAGELSSPAGIATDAAYNVWVVDSANNRLEEWNSKGEYLSQFGEAGTGEGQFSGPSGLAIDSQGSLAIADNQSRIEKWFVQRSDTIGEESVETEDDPKVEVETSKGLVDSVEGEEAGQTNYTHTGELLTAVDGPKAKTQYEYDSAKRLTKVTLPNGTWGQIKYDELGRAKSVTVSVEGGKAKTTFFAYEDEPRRTTVSPEGQPITVYDIAPDGSVLKWWNKQEPPKIENLSGSLYANKETEKAIKPEDYELLVEAHSVEGIASIQIVANGNQLVDEKTCAQDYEKKGTECQTVEDPWVTETGSWPPGILYLEVIVTSSVEGTEAVPNTESAKFWVNIPYTPPPDPEAEEPPKFNEVSSFREEFGLDLDLKGNELAIDERIFDLIGDWNNPHTPAGEVARATAEEWGVPLRAVDAAELEYRARYLETIAPMIDEWGYTNYPSSYAGYEMDHRAGGMLRIGFTQDQAVRVSEFVQQMNPPGQERISTFETTPTHSRESLETREQEVASLSDADSELSNLVNEIGISDTGTSVVVKTTNVAATEQRLAQLMPSLSGITVSYDSDQPEALTGRDRDSGRMLAGDRVWTDWTPEASSPDFTWGTAGFGAFEKTFVIFTKKWITTRFLLAAGHMGAVGANMYRVATANLPAHSLSELKRSDAAKIGRVGRNPLFEGDGAVDVLAMRFSAEGVAPLKIYGPEGHRPQIEHAGVAARGQPLCVSGARTERIKCGVVVGIKRRKCPGLVSNKRIGYLVVKGLASRTGDSGAPVWNRHTHAAVGLVSCGYNHGSVAYVQPLLTTPTGRHTQIAGALNASLMGDLHIITGR